MLQIFSKICLCSLCFERVAELSGSLFASSVARQRGPRRLLVQPCLKVLPRRLECPPCLRLCLGRDVCVCASIRSRQSLRATTLPAKGSDWPPGRAPASTRWATCCSSSYPLSFKSLKSAMICTFLNNLQSILTVWYSPYLFSNFLKYQRKDAHRYGGENESMREVGLGDYHWLQISHLGGVHIGTHTRHLHTLTLFTLALNTHKKH